eukprot:1776515-Pyramimonas_sp.AAC.1
MLDGSFDDAPPGGGLPPDPLLMSLLSASPLSPAEAFVQARLEQQRTTCADILETRETSGASGAAWSDLGSDSGSEGDHGMVNPAFTSKFVQSKMNGGGGGSS